MGVEQRLEIPPVRQPIVVEWFLTLTSGGPLEGQGRFELLDGEIFRMAPQYARHVKAVQRVFDAFDASVGEAGLNLEVFSQISVCLSDTSMPDPDIVVAMPRDHGAVPLDELVVVVEVSDSSLAYDLKRKALLYAAYGVAEYWVVDLPNAQIHQMTGPEATGYATIELHPFGARVVSKMVPQIALDSARLA